MSVNELQSPRARSGRRRRWLPRRGLWRGPDAPRQAPSHPRREGASGSGAALPLAWKFFVLLAAIFLSLAVGGVAGCLWKTFGGASYVAAGCVAAGYVAGAIGVWWVRTREVGSS